MMLILTILIVLVLLIASETWWHYKRPHNELSRKFIHMSVGSFAAFWPYFLSWNEILFLSAAFLIVVSLSQYLGIFQAIHAVERPTWGEVCFALAVGMLAVLAREPLVFTVALLIMSLSDGLAALVGTAYGKNNQYTVLGHKKSLAGSLAFFGSALVLLIGYAFVVSDPPSAAVLAGLALVATGLENIAIRGLDNLAVPLVVAGVLMTV
ncbi:MAG TPA: hypothetical protein VK978_03065 [Candidatus Saccharimonadales bacterium]|nr:hypothetical protein [Candidatus Saccharimonadales bacterium]